jgi:hypothetical protein
LEILLDERLGNTPQYYLGEKGDKLMLVPDEVRKCVVFICYKGIEGLHLAGTGFFVGVPSSIPERTYVYLITAGHIIKGIKQKSTDNKAYLRINQKNKPTILVSSDLGQWKHHPSESNIDVAILSWAPDENIFDYLFLPISMAATPEVITREEIGCGDEVFLTGLFNSHYGQQRNVPIVRIGNIACMPEEPVQTKDMGLIEAYLVEARSIGGLSGSPVFVHLSGVRKGSLKLGQEPIYWLGLMHGHFDLEKLETDRLESDILMEIKVNIGIAVVVPVSKILEVLNQDEFAKVRDKQNEVFRLQKAATPDTT